MGFFTKTSSAEKQIEKALPEMIDQASDRSLKQAFQMHLGETKNHVKRSANRS